MFGITNDMLYRFLIRAMVLFTAMPIHECAHGFVADRLGDGTPREQGRLTLNPFAHLEWSGSLLLFLTGFGWARPVSVDMRNFKHPRRDMALTALAGPASNIVMSLLIMVIYAILLSVMPMMRTSQSMNVLTDILQNIAFINVSLAVFNLLPIPPLDGSKIFGAFLPKALYCGMLRYQNQLTVVFMLLLVFGILSPVIMWLSYHVFVFLDLLTSPITALLYR